MLFRLGRVGTSLSDGFMCVAVYGSVHARLAGLNTARRVIIKRGPRVKSNDNGWLFKRSPHYQLNLLGGQFIV